MIFYKYHGCGNDFILIDGQESHLDFSTDVIQNLCDRRFGIGADGLMILEKTELADFSMRYFNSDGNESTFCGNGGRCIALFAKDLGIITDQAKFQFRDSFYSAKIEENIVTLDMQNVDDIKKQNRDFILNTGSPHYVHFVENATDFDFIPYAKSIRYSAEFPKGINVNLVEKKRRNQVYMRTYERGVEDETYSCGTGVVAAALCFDREFNPETKEIEVETKGGSFNVTFEKENDTYTHIQLIGTAEFVYRGEIKI